MFSSEKELRERVRKKLGERYEDMETLIVYKISPTVVFGERIDYILDCEFECKNGGKKETLYPWEGNLYFFEEFRDMLLEKHK